MKFCPKCQTKYDEDVIRFCTKDGSPLVDENPSFTAMPSQSFSTDDIGEETLITRNRPVIPQPIPTESEETSQRVVIPIGEEKKQAVRPLDNSQRQYQEPRKSNTAMVVLLTIFGTLAILGGGIGVWFLLSGSNKSVANTNTNSNSNANNSNVAVNYNSTLPDFGINTNANANANANSNVNTNANANLKPSPTKTPTPKPSPTVDANANTNTNLNVNTTIVNITPANTNTNTRPSTPTSTPTPTPKPSSTPTNTPPSNVNIGVMNSRAKELRRPAYPPIAKQMGAAGQVVVQISIDEQGNVIAAKALTGPALLRNPAEAAARQSSFNPVKVGDRAIRATGTVVYNFINQ